MAAPRPDASESCGIDRRGLGRRLALAKVRELRRMGMSFHEIGTRFGTGRADLCPDDAPASRSHDAPGTPRPPRPSPDADAAALLGALDAVGQELAFYDCGGSLVHANRTFFVDLTVSETVRPAGGGARLTGSGMYVNVFHARAATVPVFATCSRTSTVEFTQLGG